ncbi:MAG: immunity 17 family protein [Planctomycetota bacterium]
MPIDLKDWQMNPIGILLFAAGLFSIAGAAFDWDFFINSRKARLIVALCGRIGARIFYGILGLVIAVAGASIAFGIITG